MNRKSNGVGYEKDTPHARPQSIASDSAPDLVTSHSGPSSNYTRGETQTTDGNDPEQTSPNNAAEEARKKERERRRRRRKRQERRKKRYRKIVIRKEKLAGNHSFRILY